MITMEMLGNIRRMHLRDKLSLQDRTLHSSVVQAALFFKSFVFGSWLRSRGITLAYYSSVINLFRSKQLGLNLRSPRSQETLISKGG